LIIHGDRKYITTTVRCLHGVVTITGVVYHMVHLSEVRVLRAELAVIGHAKEDWLRVPPVVHYH
jgi:hypothetical protein